MKYITLITKFYLEDDWYEDDEITCDDILNNAIDVIQDGFEKISASGADYYSKDVEVEYEGEGKSILIDLSHCSNEHPVSASDISTIATALSMPDTREVVVRCYGVDIPIQRCMAAFYEYSFGDKYFDNPYEAAAQAISSYYEFQEQSGVIELKNEN